MGSPPGVSTHGIWQVGHSGRVGPPGLALLGFPPWVGSPSQLRSQLESQDPAKKKSHDPLLRASTGSVVMLRRGSGQDRRGRGDRPAAVATRRQAGSPLAQKRVGDPIDRHLKPVLIRAPLDVEAVEKTRGRVV